MFLVTKYHTINSIYTKQFWSEDANVTIKLYTNEANYPNCDTNRVSKTNTGVLEFWKRIKISTTIKLLNIMTWQISQ